VGTSGAFGRARPTAGNPPRPRQDGGGERSRSRALACQPSSVGRGLSVSHSHLPAYAGLVDGATTSILAPLLLPTSPPPFRSCSAPAGSVPPRQAGVEASRGWLRPHPRCTVAPAWTRDGAVGSAPAWGSEDRARSGRVVDGATRAGAVVALHGRRLRRRPARAGRRRGGGRIGRCVFRSSVVYPATRRRRQSRPCRRLARRLCQARSALPCGGKEGDEKHLTPTDRNQRSASRPGGAELERVRDWAMLKEACDEACRRLRRSLPWARPDAG
jgi:hypothetical protein